MKKLLILVTLFICVTSYSQYDFNLEITDWKEGTEKVLYGNSIKRLEGYNDRYHITNLGYQSLPQLIDKINKKAEAEMWNEEKKSSTINSYQSQVKGGILHLYIARITLATANTNMYTVIIKDKNEVELSREELKSKVPEVPRDNKLWTNYKVISIPTEIKEKFYVYLIDAAGMDGRIKYKFEINP